MTKRLVRRYYYGGSAPTLSGGLNTPNILNFNTNQWGTTDVSGIPPAPTINVPPSYVDLAAKSGDTLAGSIKAGAMSSLLSKSSGDSEGGGNFFKSIAASALGKGGDTGSGIGGAIGGAIGKAAPGILNSVSGMLGGSAQDNVTDPTVKAIGGIGNNIVGNIGSKLGISNLKNGVWGAVSNVGVGLGAKLLGKSTNYDDTAGQIASQVTGAIKNLGPWGLAIGTALDFANMAGSVKVEGTREDKERTQEVANSYNTDQYNVDDKNISGIGALTGAAGRQKRLVERMQKKLDTIADIGKDAKLDKEKAAGSVNSLSLRYQMRNSGGYQALSVKKGGLVWHQDFVDRCIKLKEEKDKQQAKFLKNGGTVNVIPSGALHKERHHIEDKVEGLEEVSNKGIPVITVTDGNVKQHAEIERNEIILRYELSCKLEELSKSEDEDADLIAGEMLVDEIFNNTDDNTGLIRKVKV